MTQIHDADGSALATTPAPHTELADHLPAIAQLLRDTALAPSHGWGLVRELQHPAASFRQRSPASWPGSQQPLFGVRHEPS